MTTLPGLSDADVNDAVRTVLRMFVGQGRMITWAALAAATGDGERKLRAYVEADPPAMPAPVFLRVFAVLPCEAINMVMRMAAYSVKPLDTDDAATARRALTDTTRFAASLSEALEDGELDHRERAQLADHAAKIIPSLQVIASGRAGG